MAGTRIQLDPVEADLDEILATMSRLETAPDDRALWVDIGEYLDLATRERFELEMAPDGTPWEPLDPAYQARKPRRQDQILVLDAFLRDQMSYDAQAGGVDFGSNRVYAATHHYGDPGRGIPERPILGVSDDDDSHIVRLAREHLSDVIAGRA